MISLKYIILLTVLMVFTTCKTSNTTLASESAGGVDAEDSVRITDFGSYLSRLMGVTVTGDDENATVTIRGGNTSITASPEPLFIMNGQPIDGGYSEVFGLIEVDNIKEINILRTAAEVAPYGVRGANGVIEIITK